ncbi:hypothetical protein Syun_007359 [Stephania yunnanensis]|uniref:Neprosin PEP catalytic domain-containing protein n=1 Tax=Stephania yunnanensis TaxID=152371 RepID=A0AAP0PYM2_9MAGN
MTSAISSPTTHVLPRLVPDHPRPPFLSFSIPCNADPSNPKPVIVKVKKKSSLSLLEAFCEYSNLQFIALIDSRVFSSTLGFAEEHKKNMGIIEKIKEMARTQKNKATVNSVALAGMGMGMPKADKKYMAYDCLLKALIASRPGGIDDASQRTWCFNLVCAGFVQTSHEVALGAAMAATSSSGLITKMYGSTPTKYVKGGCSQSTPSPKCMKTIFTKMEDKYDTLRVEVKELMKQFLSSVDEEALMALILDDEPLIACYDIFHDAAK